MRVYFPLLCFLLTGITYGQGLSEADMTYLEMNQDQELGRIEEDYQRLEAALLNEDVALEASPNCIKVQTADCVDFETVVTISYLLSLPTPIQVCNECLTYDSDTEEWDCNRYAACIDDGMVYPQSEETAEVLRQNTLFMFLEFFGVVEEKNSVDVVADLPSIYDGFDNLVEINNEEDAWAVTYFHDVDPTTLDPVTLTTVGGAEVVFYELPVPAPEPVPEPVPEEPGPQDDNIVKCKDCPQDKQKPFVYEIRPGTKCYEALKSNNADKVKDIMDSLCVYKRMTEKKLKEGECYKVTFPIKPDSRKACAAAWRALTNKICPAGDGKQNGHLPDTCAGGAPDPGPIFYPQCSTVNGNLGSQCSRHKDVCYSKIEYKVMKKVGSKFEVDEECMKKLAEAKVDLTCKAELTEEQKKKLDDLKKKWNTKFCEYVEANKGKADKDLSPVEYKNYVLNCGKKRLAKVAAEE